MSNRSWFLALNGQQQGPYPEAQVRDLIARGQIAPQTMVWCEGMAGWQQAGEVPGLMQGRAQGGMAPPARMQGGGPVMADRGYAAPADGGHGGDEAISFDPPMWGFFGRCLLVVLGNLIVIPSPWTVTGYYRWLAPRINVPGRPNLGFTGQVGDMWYVIVGLALCGAAGMISNKLQLVAIPVQAYLSWMLLRWFVGSLSSNGQPLPVRFSGDVWPFIGWYALTFLAIITIVGWAWALAAWTRWICRHIEGTRREVVFNGTGLEVLWRTLAVSLLCVLIIPIPWMLRWYARWFTSQFVLVEHGYGA